MPNNIDKFLKRVEKNREREELLKEAILVSGYFKVEDLDVDDDLNFCIDLDFNPHSAQYKGAVIDADMDTILGKIITQILDIMIVSSRLFPKISHRYDAFKVTVKHSSNNPGESWELYFSTPRADILKIKQSKAFKADGIKNREVISSWLTATQTSTYKEPIAEEMLA